MTSVALPHISPELELPVDGDMVQKGPELLTLPAFPTTFPAPATRGMGCPPSLRGHWSGFRSWPRTLPSLALPSDPRLSEGTRVGRGPFGGWGRRTY